MFPARYFAPAYYAARYWAKLGAAAPVIVRVRIQCAITPVGPVAKVIPANPTAAIV